MHPGLSKRILKNCAAGQIFYETKCAAGWGGRQTKDCSQTWSFGFHFRLESIFQMNVKFRFYYLKIGFLEYLRIPGEIRYQNGPIGYWKKLTIWKEACIVHVGAAIHDYQGERAIWSRKCSAWKDCTGAWAQLSTNNVNFFRFFLFCLPLFAAGQIYQTKCAAGQSIWRSPNGYSVLFI